MAKSNAYLIISTLVIVMASLSFPCHALIIDGLRITEVTIFGLATCDLNGDPNAPPISNATLVLRCGEATANLAQTVTNPGGFFLMFLTFLQTLLFTPNICFIRLNLPAGNCTINSPNATLTAVLTLVSVTVTNNTNIATYAASTLTTIV